jgi:hypothetical protein
MIIICDLFCPPENPQWQVVYHREERGLKTELMCRVSIYIKTVMGLNIPVGRYFKEEDFDQL